MVADAKLYVLDAPVEPAIYVPHMQRPAGSRTLEFADAAPRLHAFATVFATLALTLATVGIYGLTAYSVSRRTHEIGLRVAMGASQSQILRLVVGSGLVTALIGIGVAAVFEVTRGLSGMLYGLPRPTRRCSPAVPLLLIAVSVLASYVLARKARSFTALRSGGRAILPNAAYFSHDRNTCIHCGADPPLRGRRPRRPVAAVKALMPSGKSGSEGPSFEKN